MKFRICHTHWTEINKFLSRSFSDGECLLEWGIIGSIKKVGSHSYIIVEVFPPLNSGDFDQSFGGFKFNAQYIRRCQIQAKERKADGLVFFHTHPMADDEVCFSTYDDQEEPLLMKNLQEIWPSSHHIGVVKGKRSCAARLYTSSEVRKFGDVRIMGRQIKIIESTVYQYSDQSSLNIFDRALPLTDAGALSTLAKLSIVIVGAGGTGSLMTEVLQRSGCQDVMVIDDDWVEISNLNRVLHASCDDAKKKRKKIDVVKRASEFTGLVKGVKVLDANILDESTHDLLRDADVIIGCVDQDTPRYIMNMISRESCIPYIDIGTEIGMTKDIVQSLDVRVTHVFPGGPCLECYNLLSSDRMRLEGLQPEERRRHMRLGYCQDIDLKQPAVMELNMRAVSLASFVLRNAVQPFLDLSVNGDLRESLLTLSHRKLAPKRSCGNCNYLADR